MLLVETETSPEPKLKPSESVIRRAHNGGASGAAYGDRDVAVPVLRSVDPIVPVTEPSGVTLMLPPAEVASIPAAPVDDTEPMPVMIIAAVPVEVAQPLPRRHL